MINANVFKTLQKKIKIIYLATPSTPEVICVTAGHSTDSFTL